MLDDPPRDEPGAPGAMRPPSPNTPLDAAQAAPATPLSPYSEVSAPADPGEAPYEMDDICLKFFFGRCTASKCPRAHHFAHLAHLQNWAAFAGEDLKALQVPLPARRPVPLGKSLWGGGGGSIEAPKTGGGVQEKGSIDRTIN